MDDKAKDILKSWIDGINSRDMDKVVSMYSEKSVLFPTFSNKRLTTAKQKIAYFNQLFSHDKLSVEMHPKTLACQQLSDSIYSMSGIYCWHFDVDDEILSFESRFTYTIDLSLSSPIVHHHSSQIPRML